jgi:hypothetical protein
VQKRDRVLLRPSLDSLVLHAHLLAILSHLCVNL